LMPDYATILCYICGWSHGSLHVYCLVGNLVPESSGGSVGWSCFSSYVIPNPFSSFSPFSNSSNGVPMLSAMVGFENLPQYLLDSGRGAQETAITCFCQQALLGIHNSVWVCSLYLGWIPRLGSLWMTFSLFSVPYFVSIFPPLSILFPLLRRT
jgi:hypothetical protein